MATRDQLIRDLEQEIARVAHSTRNASTTEELDWVRSARLAVERLQSGSSSEDEVTAARRVLAAVRDA